MYVVFVILWVLLEGIVYFHHLISNLWQKTDVISFFGKSKCQKIEKKKAKIVKNEEGELDEG